MHRQFWALGALVWMTCVCATANAAEPVDADILLKRGLIHDGRGRPAVVGDVALRRGRIAAVGTFAVGKIGRTIDCDGLVVAPGFIDLHNHSDAQMVNRLTRSNVNYLTQGCTTIVTGNCGGGPIDVDEYYRKIDLAGAGTNVAHLVPQGSLRKEVVGLTQRPATAQEIEQMQRLAAKGMEDGAWGMSSGLIYVPSSYADTAELIEIAKTIAAHKGIYASHIRGEGIGLLASVQEALEIGSKAGLPVHISHFKASGKDAWGLVREAARMIDKARSDGFVVSADQYPYAASSTSLEATVIPLWASSGGQKELLSRLDDEAQKRRICEAIEEELKKMDGGERIRVARFAQRPDWAGRSIAQIARCERLSPLEITLQITLDGGAQVVNFGMNDEDVRFVMSLPWAATASDGRAMLPGADRPHPRSYGTFSRKIGQFALRDALLPVEQAIRSATALPAAILGLTDRGILAEGLAADVVVFSPDDFVDTATFDDPHRYSSGVRYVFVNGEPAIENGTPTGALAGRSLRHEANAAER